MADTQDPNAQADTQNQNQQSTNQDDKDKKDNPVAADVGVPADEQVENAAQHVESRGAASPAANSLQLNDGTDTGVAIDSSAQFDALQPEGHAEIEFDKGNYKQIIGLPQKLTDKITTISKTVLPLIQAGLIELLGNNSAFHGLECTSAVTIDNGTVKIETNAVYKVELFIGTDVEQKAIAHDANYLLNRIKVVSGVTYHKCAIDCTEGTVTVDFVI